VNARPIAPAAGADAEPQARAWPPPGTREVLLGLSRAVQRATIYPPGHPSIGVATRPFVDALARVLDTTLPLVIGFTSDGVLVGTAASDGLTQDASWLSGRLAARGVASLEFTGPLTAAEAEQLIGWLAQPDAFTPGSDVPSIGGCLVGCIDYSRASFRETPVTDDVTPAVALAWRMVCRALTGEWEPPGDLALRDPSDFACYVSGMLERQEGSGIGEFCERFAGLNGQLARLSGSTLLAIKGRLARFLDALSPEYRDRLLAATPTDSDDKLELIAQLVDRLPRPLVLDVVRGSKFERGGSAHQFVMLMVKLTEVAARDEHVASALSERFGREGLPFEPSSLASPATQQLLADLLTPREGDVAGVNPGGYQEHLEALASGQSNRCHQHFVSPRHTDPRDEQAVAGHAALIALNLLGMGEAEDADTVVCVDRVRQQLPAWLAAEQVDVLAQAASALQAAAASRTDTPASERARAAIGFFASAECVRAIVSRLERSGPAGSALTLLARSGGDAVAKSVLARLARRPGPDIAGRLGLALDALEFDVLRAALADLCASTPAFSRAVVVALVSSRAQVAAGLVEQLVGDRDPVVRAEALRLVLSRLSAEVPEAPLRRALGDQDPRVVEVGLDAVERHGASIGPATLGAFLDARRSGPVASLQHRLVRVLAKRPEPAARAVLAQVLGLRAWRFDRPSRLLSRMICLALERTRDAACDAAARAWRRSPAGFVSRLLRDVSGVVS
jgi:hypothetical protein